MKKIIVMILSVLALALTGCGAKLDGTYSATIGDQKFSYAFGSGGKVTMTEMGHPFETTYEVTGKEITIKTAKADQKLTIIDDKTLGGGANGTNFIKE